MFDADTLIISYDTQRGEPRGARKKGVDPKDAGLGDCVNCGVCVQVCPTGIDIRNGLQYECIGCAAYDEIFSQNCACFCYGHILFTQMHAVGVYLLDQFYVVVYDEGRTVVFAQALQA